MIYVLGERELYYTLVKSSKSADLKLERNRCAFLALASQAETSAADLSGVRSFPGPAAPAC